MYTVNTILTRHEPKRLRHNKPDPLNVVKVVGVSPIKKPSREEWAGGDSSCLIVTPVEQFGANEVMPVSMLQAEYDITTIGNETPETKIILDPPNRPSGAHAETPEQSFARQARLAQLADEAVGA